MIHTHTCILLYMSFSHKKWDLAICDNKYGAWGHYTKWSKSENDKYCVIYLICEILKKTKTKTKAKKQVQIYREQIDNCQRWGVECKRNKWRGSKGQEANTVDIC